MTTRDQNTTTTRVFVNVCYGGIYRPTKGPDEFRPCYDCEVWGWLDELPEWAQTMYENEYGKDGGV